MTAIKEVRLGDMQSAEAGQCGSCNLFERRNDYDSFGLCRFKMPPWYAAKFKDSGTVFEEPVNTINDKESCSNYRPAVNEEQWVRFTKIRAWEAGKVAK